MSVMVLRGARPRDSGTPLLPLLQQFDVLAGTPDGVPRLRELILALAVKGKLVPQDPGDEPASRLVERLRLEQVRTSDGGRRQHRKSQVPNGSVEALPDLPLGWEWVRLSDIVRVLNGRAYSKHELLEAGPTPVLRVGNLFTSKHWYYSDLKLEPEKYCEKGDLLYAWSASFGPFIWDGPRSIYHYHIWKLEPVLPEHFDVKYLYTFLLEKTAEIKAAGHGVSMVHMTKEKMERLAVPCPPLPEQARIVARVDGLMRLCDALEVKGRLEAEQHSRLLASLLGMLTDGAIPQQLSASWRRVAGSFDLLLDRHEAIDALEQTILDLAVHGVLVPHHPDDEPASVLLARISEEKRRLAAEGHVMRTKPLPSVDKDETPFDLPRGWLWVRLGALLKKVGAGSTPRGGRDVYVASGVKFLRSQNVWNDGLRLEGVAFITPETHAKMSGTVVQAKDLLFNITGASIGRCAMVPADFDEANVSQHVTIIRPVLASLVPFLHKVLLSHHLQQAVRDVQVGVSREGLSIAKLERFLVPLPPLAEQSRIVARVIELQCCCADLRRRLVARQAMRSRLADAHVDAAVAQ
jgi:type I restriction enzyme S subunit